MDQKNKPTAIKTMPTEDCAMFCQQVAMVLRSGIPMHDGIEALCESYQDTHYGTYYKQLDEHVKQTGSLYEALCALDIFSPYMVQMVHIGEMAGTLENVMTALGDHYERETQIRKSIHNAITYPLLLILMMAAVIVLLISTVLPVFNQVFRNLGMELSATSATIMGLAMTTGNVVLCVIGLILVITLVLSIVIRTKHREKAFQVINRVIPPIRKINEKLSAQRFASVMAAMMRSGYPIQEAVDLLPLLLTSPSALAKVQVCKDALAEGASFPDAIERTHLFEPLHAKMIRVGFSTGQVDQVMDKLAAMYQTDIDDRIHWLVSIIEPTLVAILSIIIGAILLAVMLPLASILSSII